MNQISVRYGIPFSKYPQPKVHPTVHHYPSLVKTASQQVHSSLQQALRWSKDCQQFSVSFVAACPSVVATANNEKTWIFSQTPSRSMGSLSHSQWECIYKPLLGLLLVGEKRWFFPLFHCCRLLKTNEIVTDALALTHVDLRWLSFNQLESRSQARTYLILNILVPWI